jgi:acetyl-CoA carboxylase carboxyl transferase subunit alpha
MELADRFGIPVVTLIDTAGAYPGVGAEERGQAEAIARSTETCLNIKRAADLRCHRRGWLRRRDRHRHGQPGLHARARDLLGDFARGRRLHSLARRDPRQGRRDFDEDHGPGSARSSALSTASSHEPVGGAHRDPDSVMSRTGDVISGALSELSEQSGGELRSNRRKKFLKIGRQIG